MSWIAPFGITWLFVSVAVKVPAWLVMLFANRAVRRYPPRVCVGSVILTLKCCTTPGVYVVPEGKTTTALPPVAALPL